MCTDYTWGNECENFCGNCKYGATCNQLTGECPYDCEAGWYGYRCDTCKLFRIQNFGCFCKDIQCSMKKKIQTRIHDF